MSEGGDLNRALDCKASAVQLDSLNLMKRLGRHVALTAVRAVNDRDALDEQNLFPLAVRPRNLSNPCPLFSAVIACHLFTFA